MDTLCLSLVCSLLLVKTLVHKKQLCQGTLSGLPPIIAQSFALFLTLFSMYWHPSKDVPKVGQRKNWSRSWSRSCVVKFLCQGFAQSHSNEPDDAKAASRSFSPSEFLLPRLVCAFIVDRSSLLNKARVFSSQDSWWSQQWISFAFLLTKIISSSLHINLSAINWIVLLQSSESYMLYFGFLINNALQWLASKLQFLIQQSRTMTMMRDDKLN